MSKSKNILTFLLFLLFAFIIWLVNAFHKQMQNDDDGVVNNTIVETEQMYTEKRITLPIEAVGVPANKTLHIFPSKADVYVRLRVEDYDELTKEDVRVWCTYPMTQTDVLILHVDVSDGKAMSVRIEPEEVEYIIDAD